MVTEKNKISPTIKEMEIGELLEFPIENLNYIKSLVSNIGLIQKKQFTTKQNKEKRIVEVERKK